MPVLTIESRITPPNLTIKDIRIPTNSFTFGSFHIGSPSYDDALACLQMYRKQVTQLDYEQRCEMIKIITEGQFFRTRTAMKSPYGHKFYRYAYQNHFAGEHISWPKFIIMRALYKDDVPSLYVRHIKQTFGTAAIEDFSHRFFEYFPEMNDGTTNPIIPTPTVNIRDGKRKLLVTSRKRKDMKGAEDNFWPASKRTKTHAEETQQRESTSVASNAAVLEATPTVDLDTRDILDRLPSKTSGQGFKRIDRASWDRLQHLLKVIRKKAIISNIRFEALEESHRGLERKLGEMATAFEAMNTTIGTVIAETRADREQYSHVLGSIRDIMMGMADSIKDIKEQL